MWTFFYTSIALIKRRIDTTVRAYYETLWPNTIILFIAERYCGARRSPHKQICFAYFIYSDKPYVYTHLLRDARSIVSTKFLLWSRTVDIQTLEPQSMNFGHFHRSHPTIIKSIFIFDAHKMEKFPSIQFSKCVARSGISIVFTSDSEL